MVGTVFGCYLSRTFFAVIVNVKYVNKATLMQFNQHNCPIIAASKNVTTPCMCLMVNMRKEVMYKVINLYVLIFSAVAFLFWYGTI